MDEPAPAPANLAHALLVLRRRWLVVLAVVVLLPAAAYFFSSRQAPRYQGEASVQLSRQNLANSLTGTQDASAFTDPQRLTTTQANVARSSVVGARVVRRVPDAHLTVKAFLAASSVDTSADSDVLSFKATNRRAALAQRLALVFAQEYTRYRLVLDSRSLTRALGEARASLRGLRPSQSALRNQIEAKIQQLQTLEALQTSNASVIGASVDASQVAPRPIRNAILALLLAVAAGIALAFLIDALDTRVRSVDRISEELDIPLLARIPAPRMRIQRAHQLVVAADPSSPAAEALRALRTSLDYVMRQQGGSTLLITSAVTAEGKTTTAANLAALFARSGRDVMAVDFDLHRPTLARYFGLERSPGVTDLLFGESTLEEALHPVEVPGVTSGRSDVRAGTLTVVPAGSALPPGLRLFEARHLDALFAALRDRSDLILVDTAPLLRISDTLDLCAHVDSALLVCRLKHLRRPALRELKRVLVKCPATITGFAETDAQQTPAYGYGYGYAKSSTDGATRRGRGDRKDAAAAGPSWG